MFSNLFSRRAFASRIATLLPGLGIAAAASAAVPSPLPMPAKDKGVKKLDAEGKPADKGFITPLIIHNGVIYIAGIGAHSHNKAEFPKDITNHTKSVMDSVKSVIEVGGGTMDSILQLTVFLASIDDYKGMNDVFKTYFPNGGPARTTVAVAALPGDSLVEINCTAAVVKK
jgi:enamine deaminase RidA (YjgF/YER057c/UK114 family)